MELNGARWRKSSRSSGNGGNCVEVADNLPGSSAYAIPGPERPGARLRAGDLAGVRHTTHPTRLTGHRDGYVRSRRGGRRGARLGS
ncbi:DUF397 domain-containing protein [Micromonospora sp. M12]